MRQESPSFSRGEEVKMDTSPVKANRFFRKLFTFSPFEFFLS